jgi:hypothetical protein
LTLDSATTEELFPYILGRCEHDPEQADGPALCDTCSSVFVILIDRVTEPEDPLH